MKIDDTTKRLLFASGRILSSSFFSLCTSSLENKSPKWKTTSPSLATPPNLVRFQSGETCRQEPVRSHRLNRILSSFEKQKTRQENQTVKLNTNLIQNYRYRSLYTHLDDDERDPPFLPDTHTPIVICTMSYL